MARYEALFAETIAHPGHGGDPVEAYIARPLGIGPHPGVVIVHHNPGWDDSTKELALRFARAGYSAITPNLFYREGGEVSPDDAAAAARAQGWPADVQASDDLAGAAAYLRALPNGNGRLGLIGFCSGGRRAFLAACQLDFDAVVDCYGGAVVPRTPADAEATDKRPVLPIALAESMNAPLLGIFGEEDENPAPPHVAETQAVLERLGKPHEFHSYAGAGHGFMDYRRPAYRIAAANDAWEKILGFFGRHLQT